MPVVLLHNFSFIFLLSMFILHLRERESYRYTLDSKKGD